MKKKLPINVSNFKELIENNYLYVDKTEDIYTLINLTKNYFFCRPRRFGKSLLVSTFESLFNGNKKLFEGLWIYDKYEFKEYPVIKLDLSGIQANNSEKFEQELIAIICEVAELFDIDISSSLGLNSKFRNLIRKLNKTKGPVVVLIDEYDDPIIKNINNFPLAESIRKILIEFFKVLKSENEYLKFLFVTGVTKFSKETIFSGMNNLFDLSLSTYGKTLLGYSQYELEYYFSEHISSIAQNFGTTSDSIKNDIKEWYNGYRFSIENIRVYNPYSILNYFIERELRNYWLTTATSNLIVDRIKKNRNIFDSLLKSKFVLENFTTFDIENINDAALFFQTGYLTILNYNAEFKYFELGFPNSEVEGSVQKCLLSAYINQNLNAIDPLVLELTIAIKKQDFCKFFDTLKVIFSNIPYQIHINQEKYYHAIMQVICSILPFEANSEILTDKGRIDLVIETDANIDIFEFKFNSSPSEALQQIEDMRYYQKYLGYKKNITLLGVSFMKSKQNFDIKWVSKELCS